MTVNTNFSGKTFKIIGFNEEYTKDLITIIKQRCGLVKPAKYAGIPDYVVAPVLIEENVPSREIVNHFYIIDCDDANKILPKEYYHDPIVTGGTSKPLQGLTITTTNYLGSERTFVRELLQYLGAEYLNTLAKCAPNASSHLVCKTPNGKKYLAAISWGIPVIDCRWLLACLQTDSRVDEKEFLVKKNQGL